MPSVRAERPPAETATEETPGTDDAELTANRADHACQIVLRDATVRFGEAFATDASGFPWFVVEANVDVAHGAANPARELLPDGRNGAGT